ncbi:MAG: hypothetical protein EOO61_01095 [Hymenobacter sp.]|nr:MAG: hypothetical protein EOO61_01095 [Hymenobacter sp.]
MADPFESLYSTYQLRRLSWPDLYYIEMETEVGLHALQKLCINQEFALTSAVKGFENYLANDPTYSSLDSDELKGSYISQVFEREEMIIEELRRQQRYSMCMSIYSFFEGRLRTLCEYIEAEFPFKIKLNDLNSSDHIMQFVNYIAKVYEADLSKTESYFTPIKISKAVRNVIAHHDGCTSNRKLTDSIEKKKGFYQERHGASFKIVIRSEKYILYLIDKMELYFKELLKAVDERYVQLHFNLQSED